MHINLILSVLFIGICLICAWQGFKKGIIMGMVEILVIIVSIYGAQLLSDAYSYEVIPALKPFVAGFMESRVDDTAYAVLGYEADENGKYDVLYSLRDLLNETPEAEEPIYLECYRNLGIYDKAAQSLAEKTVQYKSENSCTIEEAVTNVVCETITWVGGFLIAFILLFVVLTVIVNLPNLSFRIPFVGLVNDIGGLILGVLTGFIFCSLILWFFQYVGIVLPEATVMANGPAAYFTNMNVLNGLITF